MSRFSTFVHEHFGTGAPNETAADIIVRHIPDTGQLVIVKEAASDVVAVMEGTGLSGAEKKRLATLAVNFALAAAHISIPASVVSFLIEEAVLLLKGGKASTTPVVVPPAEPPAPEHPYYIPLAAYPATKDYKTGDMIYQRGDGLFVVEPSGVGTVIPPDWRLVETIGA